MGGALGTMALVEGASPEGSVRVCSVHLMTTNQVVSDCTYDITMTKN